MARLARRWRRRGRRSFRAFSLARIALSGHEPAASCARLFKLIQACFNVLRQPRSTEIRTLALSRRGQKHRGPQTEVVFPRPLSCVVPGRIGLPRWTGPTRSGPRGREPAGTCGASLPRPGLMLRQPSKTARPTVLSTGCRVLARGKNVELRIEGCHHSSWADRKGRPLLGATLGTLPLVVACEYGHGPLVCNHIVTTLLSRARRAITRPTCNIEPLAERDAYWLKSNTRSSPCLSRAGARISLLSAKDGVQMIARAGRDFIHIAHVRWLELKCR